MEIAQVSLDGTDPETVSKTVAVPACICVRVPFHRVMAPAELYVAA